MIKQKNYLTSREAAALLNVAVSTIQLWTNSGLLKAWTTAGGHRRIAKKSVEEILSKQHQSQPLSIVVVDDNLQDQKLYKEHFELWKMDTQFSISNDGYAGLINIGKLTPNVIITDLMMPNMDGFEMIKAIKENPDLKDSLIIAVSALTSDEIKKLGGLPTDIPVFTKPVPFNELKTVIQNKRVKNVT